MPKAKLISFSLIKSIQVEVDWKIHRKNLKLVYSVSGNLKSLQIPEISNTPSRVEGLYHHTCFEVFINLGEKYLEWNFSPSGDWCTFVFDSYRNPAHSPADLKLEPSQFSIAQSDQKLILEVEVPMDADLFSKNLPTRMGLTSVLENEKGALSYWALNHPTQKPDFHQAESFLISFSREMEP